MNFISVLVKDRGISSMDFFHNAIKLRKMIVELLLRDFGIKDKIRNPKVLMQQSIEMQIKNANTVKEINNIVINYD